MELWKFGLVKWTEIKKTQKLMLVECHDQSQSKIEFTNSGKTCADIFLVSQSFSVILISRDTLAFENF